MWRTKAFEPRGASRLVYLAVRLHLEEAGGGKPRRARGRDDDVEDGAIGAGGLRAALEDRAVAALDAEARDLDQGVGTGLEDDAYHPDGTAHPRELQPLVELATQQHPSDRVRQVGETVESCADVCKLVLVEAQAPCHGRSHAPLPCGGEVPGVGGEDGALGLNEPPPDAGEGLVPALQGRGGHLGALELHVCGDFPDVSHGYLQAHAGRAGRSWVHAHESTRVAESRDNP